MFAPFAIFCRTTGPVSRRFIDKLYSQRYKIGLNNTMKTTFTGAQKCLPPH